jgi:hypothetical protein
MTDLIVVPQAAHWQRLKRLVLDSVSSPITRRVYNLGLDEFFAWFSQEPRPGFTQATVCAWRVALEARGLGAVSINVRITAVRKLAVEAADNGLLAPELASGITRVKGVASKGVRLGNWLPGDWDSTFWQFLLEDHARLLKNAILWAANEEPVVAVNGPGLLDVTVWRQQDSMTVHLVNLSNPMAMRGYFREFLAVGPLRLRVRLPEAREAGRSDS